MAITDLTGTKWKYSSRWKYASGRIWSVNVVLTTKTGTVIAGDTLSVRHATNGRSRTFTLAYIGETQIGYSYKAVSLVNIGNYPESALLNGEYLGGTLEITGGTDATNADLISWLEANGKLIPTYSFKHRYRNTKLIGTGTYKFRPYTVAEPPAVYVISVTATNCTASADNPTTIEENKTATLTFTANEGYTLPESVTASGATSSWDSSTGTLVLSNPTGNVTITVECVLATPKLSTPANVSADGTTVSFDEVENATSYEIFADGISIGTIGGLPVYKATVNGLGNSDPTSQTYTMDEGFPTTFEEVTKDGDIFIKIPTMYRKVNTVVDNQITSFTIATAKEDDSYLPYPCFVRPDGSIMEYILIGKYMISSSSIANSVNATRANLTPANSISLCKSKGTGYYAYDIWTQKLFQDLELVIGKKVNYNSGTKINTSKIGLEHLTHDHWVHGIIGSSGSWYVCYDPDKYQALVSTGSAIPQDYVKVGYAQSKMVDGVEIKKLGYDTENPFCNYPTVGISNSSYDTYYCDEYYYEYESGNRPVYSCVGDQYANRGLWNCHADGVWYGLFGARLCYRPLQEGVTQTNYIADSDGNILQDSNGNNLEFKEA